MSDQTAQPAQSPQELKQQMLEQLEVSKKTIEELSDEELEMVAGGASALRISADVFHDAHEVVPLGQKVSSALKGAASGIFHDKTIQAGVAGTSAAAIVMGPNKLRGGSGGGD